MQQQFTVLAAGKGLENFAPELRPDSQARAKIIWQQFVDLTAQMLRECGAFSGSGDCDLQICRADHRSEKEIAVRNIVNAVAKNPTLDCAPINSRVHLGRIGGSNDQVVSVEIGEFKSALDPFDFAFRGKRSGTIRSTTHCGPATTVDEAAPARS